MNPVVATLISALGMLAVGVSAACYWRRRSGESFKWLWIGAGLWAVAVVLKLLCGLAINQAVLGFLSAELSRPLFLLVGGAFIGLESALFEIGFTWLAVLLWRDLGKDAPHATGIGVGAGAFEALLLGLIALVGASVAFADGESRMEAAEQVRVLGETTPLFWLVAPVERLIALLGHTASRALVLLGTFHRRPAMVVYGWLLFTVVDGVAGGFILTGRIKHMSTWWVEAAVLPFALISIPILRWCWRKWPSESAVKPAESS